MLPELAVIIPWVCLLLVFLGMVALQWRVIGALDLTLQRSTPTPQPKPIPPPPVAVQPTPIVPVPQKPPKISGPFGNAPSWFQWALHEIGFHEIGNNRGIGRYINLAHAGVEGDPWCAIFANAALESCAIHGTRSAASQSFRTHAEFVQLAGPCLGAIVVFWRGSKGSGLGHVGFYRGENADHIWTLGGNENNMVQIEALAKARSAFGLVGYWWPRSVPLPKIKPIIMPSGSPIHVLVPPTESIPSTPENPSGNQVNITATYFGGQKSAYGGPIIDTNPGVALPFHFTGTRPRVRVTNRKVNLSVDCDIVDVGPWNTNDPYWQTGARPEAETKVDMTGRKTNSAGIDLTIAAAKAIKIDGKGLVDWAFIDPNQPI